MTSNRYRAFDRKEVGGIWHKLKSMSGVERDQLAERLADFDPVDLLNYVPGIRDYDPKAADQINRLQDDVRRARRNESQTKSFNRKILGSISQERAGWSTREAWLDKSHRPDRQCANCKRRFYATRADAVTCSPRCRTALHRKRAHTDHTARS